MAEGRTPGGPPSPDRRKLLLVLGYGAASVLALRELGSTGTDGQTHVDGLTDGHTSPSEPAAVEGAAAAPAADHVYDAVLANGRVMDPASGYDRVANVGIDGPTVAAISTSALTGRTIFDVVDRVVAPGFIDILSYEPNGYGIWFKIADGVTTNLGCHGLDARAPDFFARWGSEGSPCHYGGAYDNPWMRGEGWIGLGSGDAATADQIARLKDDVAQQIDQGWIGVDFEPEYTPGITYDEMRAQAEVAAEKGVPCFFHGRYSDNQPPGTNRDTLDEIIRIAKDTGAGVHVEHITSTGGTFSMPDSLALLDQALADGHGVSACMYPYDFWATYLASPRFADGWQDRYHISYGDLEIPGTGERLTEATFRQYREENKLAVAYAIPDDDVVAGLKSSLTMIGSDAILEPENNNHPRSTGCFTRTLGVYVRERKVLSLMDALAKMTIRPARRLEARAPALRRKGRLQRGADADITVFDPTTVSDRSTVANPAQEAVGIDYVLVNGQVVKSPEGLHKDVRPGTPITYGV